MNIDNIARQSLLYDFYGALLTKRQKQVMELYHEENLSLAEIAQELEISRQGVHDALKKAEHALEGYEEKLGLVAKFGKTEDAIAEIDARIEALIAGGLAGEPAGDSAGEPTEKHAEKHTQKHTQNHTEKHTETLTSELKKIRKIIDKLEE